MRWARVQRWFSPGVEFADDPAARLCARCGYPFPGGREGLPAACSECGTHIDPARLGDLRPQGPPDVIRRLLRAPGAWHLLVTAAGACILAAGNAVPGGYFGLELTGFSVVLVAWLAWLLRAAIAALAALRAGRFRDASRQRGWWLNAGAGIVLPMLAASPLPMHAVFLVERRRLDAAAAAWAAAPDQTHAVDFRLLPGGSTVDPSYADAVANSPQITAGPGWADGGFGIAVPRTGFIFETGIYYYLPNLPPQGVPSRVLRHLGGPWFAGHHLW